MNQNDYSSKMAPALDPTRYPGEWPPVSVIVGQADILLAEAHHIEELVADKIPILAVGSNASPAQLRYKFREMDFNVLTLLARAPFSVGYAGFQSPYGAIPATPVFDQTETLVRCQFVSKDELATLDATELPHYRRRTLEAEVEFLGKVQAQVYESSYGALIDSNGTPFKMSPLHHEGLSQGEVLESFNNRLPRATYGIEFRADELEQGKGFRSATLNFKSEVVAAA